MKRFSHATELADVARSSAHICIVAHPGVSESMFCVRHLDATALTEQSKLNTYKCVFAFDFEQSFMFSTLQELRHNAHAQRELFIRGKLMV